MPKKVGNTQDLKNISSPLWRGEKLNSVVLNGRIFKVRQTLRNQLVMGVSGETALVKLAENVTGTLLGSSNVMTGSRIDVRISTIIKNADIGPVIYLSQIEKIEKATTKGSFSEPETGTLVNMAEKPGRLAYLFLSGDGKKLEVPSRFATSTINLPSNKAELRRTKIMGEWGSVCFTKDFFPIAILLFTAIKEKYIFQVNYGHIVELSFLKRNNYYETPYLVFSHSALSDEGNKYFPRGIFFTDAESLYTKKGYHPSFQDLIKYGFFLSAGTKAPVSVTQLINYMAKEELLVVPARK